jgi:hypothetical protein
VTERDPRIDPRENDVLRQADTDRCLLVDLVRDGWVYYREVERGGPPGVWRIKLEEWRKLALRQCAALEETTT